jgi:AcrR family transcriptional regulator
MFFSMSNRPGLRERKKQATRAAISQIATRLFIERGFDNVTVAEIADAANVAKMTVFNYFARKEDLFFDRDEESRELVRDALAGRARGESPIAALRRLAQDLAARKHPFAKFTASTATFWRTVGRSAALSARAREMRDEFVDDLSRLLADSAGRPHSDPQAHLAAAMIVAAWTTAYREGLRRRGASDAGSQGGHAFLDLVERGFAGVAAALKGTPYV